MAQSQDNRLCMCGCGEFVKPRKTWVRGHHVRVNHPTKGKGRPRLLDGYVFLPIQSDHPYFEMAMMIGESWYIAEHRLVMAEHLGRPLKGGQEGEIVHHLLESEGGSGSKTDNRIENLRLFPDHKSHIEHHGALAVASRTHCYHGHELTPENLTVVSERWRCRTCRREEARERRARLRDS